MTKRKRVRAVTYTGLGFPVVLRNVDLVQFRDAWAPDIRLNELSENAFVALATKPAPLTGDEVRFIRQRLRMTLTAFADHFRVTHTAVMKWERAGARATGMGWGTEIAVRLAVLDASRTGAKLFREAYQTIAGLALGDAESVVMVHDPEDPGLAGVGYEPLEIPASESGSGATGTAERRRRQRPGRGRAESSAHP